MYVLRLFEESITYTDELILLAMVLERRIYFNSREDCEYIAVGFLMISITLATQDDFFILRQDHLEEFNSYSRHTGHCFHSAE